MIIHLIIQSVLLGFSLYSIVYLMMRAFKSKWKEKEIKNLDRSACILFAISGILFFIFTIWDVNSTLESISMEPGTHLFIDQFSLDWWLIVWLQPTLYLICSQLMWVPQLRHTIGLRIPVILVMLIPTEKIIILITALHRDYIPSSWTIPFIYIVQTWILYIFIFAFLLTLFHLLMQVAKKKEIQ